MPKSGDGHGPTPLFLFDVRLDRPGVVGPRSTLTCPADLHSVAEISKASCRNRLT
jgi:hypothetical protein